LSLTLLEPNQKKTAFLRHVIGTLNLESAVVIPKRIEELVKELDCHNGFVHIVTRAVDATQILPFINPLLTAGGQFILCRSKPLNSIPNLFGLELAKEISYTLPYGYGKRVLSILTPQPSAQKKTVPRGTAMN
jgi:16S rRNA G527 N7-methylase RsmG